ncbi:MAG: hypothetical protein HY319_32120 [Armatimonadetes bacterium]|nr:hypothetical protein [Armatimonadota bacterium]
MRVGPLRPEEFRSTFDLGWVPFPEDGTANPSNGLRAERHVDGDVWVTDGEGLWHAIVSHKSFGGPVQVAQMGYEGAYVLHREPQSSPLKAAEKKLLDQVKPGGGTWALTRFLVGGVGPGAGFVGRLNAAWERRRWATKPTLRVPEGCTAFSAGPAGELALCYDRKVLITGRNGTLEKVLEAPAPIERASFLTDGTLALASIRSTPYRLFQVAPDHQKVEPVPLRSVLATRAGGGLREWIETQLRQALSPEIAAKLLSEKPYIQQFVPDRAHERMALVWGEPESHLSVLDTKAGTVCELGRLSSGSAPENCLSWLPDGSGLNLSDEAGRICGAAFLDPAVVALGMASADGKSVSIEAGGDVYTVPAGELSAIRKQPWFGKLLEKSLLQPDAAPAGTLRVEKEATRVIVGGVPIDKRFRASSSQPR